MALDYAKRKVAFGRPIAALQHAQPMLAEMALNLELSTLLRDKTARMIEASAATNAPIPLKEASMVKWFCPESAERAARSAIQIMGGAGYMEDVPLSRLYRDIRVMTIADGATEIQKVIIARELGLIERAAFAF